MQCLQQDRSSLLQPCPQTTVENSKDSILHAGKRFCNLKSEANITETSVAHLELLVLSCETKAEPDTLKNRTQLRDDMKEHNEWQWVTNCMRGAEMSAAHKAFWLPFAQQSDTASDLIVSANPRHGETTYQGAVSCGSRLALAELAIVFVRI